MDCQHVRWSMRMKHIAAVIVVTAVLLFTQTYTSARGAEYKIPQTVDMTPVAEEPAELYALSAVLMDGESGRVLYEKDGERPLANASTTKVLTCIVALENSPGDDYVQVSQNAASQPEVKLGLQKGEQYYLEDLLYSLMLKSHNDTAVAIAEHCGGSVEGFARMLNRKAKQIGCKNTYFITPNGLDAEDENGKHHTTAKDLALIMRYAIKNETFLHIAQTRDYTFSEITGKRTFSVHNANAFLDMRDGVLAGKTGYTSQAGYFHSSKLLWYIFYFYAFFLYFFFVEFSFFFRIHFWSPNRRSRNFASISNRICHKIMSPLFLYFLQYADFYNKKRDSKSLFF